MGEIQRKPHLFDGDAPFYSELTPAKGQAEGLLRLEEIEAALEEFGIKVTNEQLLELRAYLEELGVVVSSNHKSIPKGKKTPLQKL